MNLEIPLHIVPNRLKVTFMEMVYPILVITKPNPGTKTKITLVICISFKLTSELLWFSITLPSYWLEILGQLIFSANQR